jgi:rubrerythrin
MHNHDDATDLVAGLELSLEGLLAAAMREEHEAYRYYTRVAGQTGHPESRTLLLKLATVEQEHFVSLHRAFRQRFPDAFTQAMVRARTGNAPRLFQEGHLEESPPEDVLEVLGAARWMEQRAHRGYLEAALTLGDDEAETRALLRSLARAEQGHFDALTALRDNYLRSRPAG